MKDRVYFSDIKNETWQEAESIRYVLIPRKWWSIKQWKLTFDFAKNIQLFFMKKD